MTLRVMDWCRVAILVSVAAAPVKAGEIMTAEELLETIPGATLSGISNEDHETRWVQVYHADGSAEGQFGDRAYSARWSVRRNLWCEEWSNRSGCWRMERIDENTLQPHYGDQKLPNVWTIERQAGVSTN